MYSRRKFVIQGSMATTALLALDPFKAASSVITPFTELSAGNGKLIFLHTANPDLQIDYKVMNHIADIQSDKANAIILQAGHAAKLQYPGRAVFDFSIDDFNEQDAITDNFKIIKKGNIKTGLISAKAEDADVIQKVNTLSTFLKKEKGCNLVVCLSQLGYKNKNTPDDITMAKQSIHLDLIIGGNIKNAHKLPVILLNQNNEEVIIHSTTMDSFALGKVDIEFNENGLKKYISFSNS